MAAISVADIACWLILAIVLFSDRSRMFVYHFFKFNRISCIVLLPGERDFFCLMVNFDVAEHQRHQLLKKLVN